MEGSGLRAGKKGIIKVQIRGYLLALALIVSLMTAGSPVFAGTAAAQRLILNLCLPEIDCCFSICPKRSVTPSKAGTTTTR